LFCHASQSFLSRYFRMIYRPFVYIPPIIHAAQDATIKASVPNENRGVGTPFYVQQSFGLCNFDWSTQGFTPETGTWAISSGRYHVSGGPSNRISVGRVHCNDCVAKVTARTGSGSTYPNNGFIIFDHVNSSNYKLAGFNAETGKWVIGEMVSGAFMVKATAARTFQQSTDYTFDVRLVSSTKTVTITLSGSQSPIVSYTFSSLNPARISLGTVFSKEGWFDDFDVFLGGPGTEAEDRALIKFDQAQIASEVGTAQLVQAKLWVYIEKSQWADSGHNILAHRLTSGWSENNVTWNCASDSNTSNGSPDCASQWAGGSYISQPTASVLHAHDQTGWVAFDVTADVNAFLSGTANYGWVLKKNAEPDRAYGVISYTSRDGTPANTPNLMLYVQDDTPPTITPVINPAPNAAGWNNSEVTVSFVCSDSGSGIQTCPDPVVISEDGANQVVSGTATDKAGNSATDSVTINLDMTQPDLAVTSPSEGAVLHQTEVQITGTVADSLSGLTSLTCNGTPVGLASGSFTCDLSLSEGLNSITFISSDTAGNQSEGELKITYTAQSENTYTFYPTGDVAISNSYDYGNGSNHGLDSYLRIESSGAEGGVLVQFSNDQLLSTIGTQHVISATLQMYVENNSYDWGSGSAVDVHRLTTGWDETGVTYACAPIDTDLHDPGPNCEEEWDGGYYEPYVSDSILEGNDSTGWQSFEVTGDLQLLLSGIDNFRWLLRKRNYAVPGTLDFTSNQGIATHVPRLVVVADDQPCSPAHISDISPSLFTADESTNTIHVAGQGLDNVTQVLRNGAPIEFTIVSSDELTFEDSAATPETHDFQFKSSCITEPLNIYTVEATDPSYGLMEATTVPGVTCSAWSGTNTDFSTGWESTDTSKAKKYLCYRGRPVELIGNGLPELISDDDAYVTGGVGGTCMISNEYCSGAGSDTVTRGFMENARYTSGHGSNMIRVWVHGHSNTSLYGPESMPFQKVDQNPPQPPQYEVKGTPPLEPRYKNRLRQVLTEANNNGQIVILSLFDHDVFRGDLAYFVNPWNPRNSDTEGIGLPTGQVSAGKQFYKICNVDTKGGVCTNLSPLGIAQRNLVRRILAIVRNGGFRKVIIELANEAIQSDSNDLNSYLMWYKTVATWVKNNGAYMVEINPGPDHLGTTKYFLGCTPGSCTSSSSDQYSIVFYNKIDLHSLHGGAWGDYPSLGQQSPCTIAKEALKIFSKPVIINDDGGATTGPRNINSKVFNWASAITWPNCQDATISLYPGTVHFEHLEEGNQQPPGSYSLFTCTPTKEPDADTIPFIDCDSYDKLGNVLGNITPIPNFCVIASSSCPPLSNPPRYCFKQGIDCPNN
jgi:hypothetical protein